MVEAPYAVSVDVSDASSNITQVQQLYVFLYVALCLIVMIVHL